MAALDTSVPVFGLSHELPAGLRLSSSSFFKPRATRPPGADAWDLERLPRPAAGDPALVKTPADGVEEVPVDTKLGPLVGKVGGGSDLVRMGVPRPGFQRKWWFDASVTEREVHLIQAAKTNRSRRDLAPPEPGNFHFVQCSMEERLSAAKAARSSSFAEAPRAAATVGAPAEAAVGFKSAESGEEAAELVAAARELDEADEEFSFEIVVYGATGFTGCLIVEHLDAIMSGPGSKRHRWALAGRNMDALLAIAGKCRTCPSVFGSQELASLAAHSRVVIAAAGPYCVCGRAVVEACVEGGAHYVDVTGETVFVHDMVEAYHERARSKGVMIVHCAGQIAVPDDVACYLLVRRLGPLKWFREYWNSLDGVTGGTFGTSVESLRRMASPEVLAVEADPFSLGGLRRRGLTPEDKDCATAERDELVFPGTWLQPTYNSRTGSRVIRRTCALFEESPADGVAYGEGLSVTIREPAASQRTAQKAAEDSALPASAEVADLLASRMAGQQQRGEAPPPGQGPPPKLRARHWSEVYAVAESAEGKLAYVRYTGPQSYEVTAMSSVAAALTLVEEPEAVKAGERAGVLTPAFAMHGSSWIERLQERAFASGSGRRMHFEVVAGKPPPDKLKAALNSRMRGFAELRNELTSGELRAWELPALLSR